VTLTHQQVFGLLIHLRHCLHAPLLQALHTTTFGNSAASLTTTTVSNAALIAAYAAHQQVFGLLIHL
jgi:hypothetical protein